MNYEKQDTGTPVDPVSPATEAESRNQYGSSDPTTSEINKIVNSVNLAEDMEEEKLQKIGRDCLRGFEVDLESRNDWENSVDEWTELAMQAREQKNFPWRNASNVKYPLLSTAAMQFAARAYPALVPSDGQIVKTRVLGADPMGVKTEKAERVSKFMSYQIMYDMKHWEEDMDKLLMMLPIIGTCFKKTYFDSSIKQTKSCLILPKDLVVNNWAKSLESAERISEVIKMSPRILEERVRLGIFREVDLDKPSSEDGGVDDETTPYNLVEQHRYLDLDSDGYEEPYIVTFQRESGIVLRIVARYEVDAVETNDDGDILKITPTCYYTKYPFIPNPDGSFYGIGFGMLLGPLNESVNTLINQLIDAGSLSNLQSGFIGKGLRLKMGESGFAPGEWKPVNATGDDLRKQIVPLPAKDPSSTLFQLLGMLVTSGKELASVAEIFTGKMPGQNTPATTTMATVEQGMKVFTAIYKRVYRSLEEEFKKIYALNGIYLNPETYVEVLDEPVGPDDFDNSSYDICPGADPMASSMTEKMQKNQMTMEMLQLFGPMMNPIEVLSRILRDADIPNWQQLMSQEVLASGQVPQQPDPKMMEAQAKIQLEEQKAQIKNAQLQTKMQIDQMTAQQKMAMEQQMHQQDMQMKMQENQINSQVKIHEARTQMATSTMNMQQQAAAGEQKLQQNEASFKQKQEQAKSSQQANSKIGKTPSPAKPSSKK